MKSKLIYGVLLIAMLALSSFQKNGNVEPWTEKQLLAPGELARKINSPVQNIAIFNIGPSGKIKNSITIGATQEKSNLASLKKRLVSLPKNTEIVIYCGCCPFANCPNIRPAFELVKEMKFTNAKLLNLPKNLKVDWIDKGYPMEN